jgi:hypothetical protein
MKAKALNPASVRPAEQAIDEAVKGMIRGKTLAWIKANWTWLGGVIAIMGTTTFIEFLFEEMLQTQGMAIYVAIANKQWDVAKETLDKAKPNLATATWIYNDLGWLAPYSWKVFKTYAEATQLQYDSYEKVINSKIGYAKAPEVFNKTKFEENLSAQTAPNVKGLVAEGIAEPVVPAEPVTPTEEVAPVVPAELIKITKEEFFDAMKGFYVGRMYLSKKELAELVKKYDATDIQNFIDEIYTYYVGRMYLSKKEIKALGAKYGFDVSGL